MSLSPKMTPRSPIHSSPEGGDYVHVRSFADPIHDRTLVVVEVWVLDEEVPVALSARENNRNVARAALRKALTHFKEEA